MATIFVQHNSVSDHTHTTHMPYTGFIPRKKHFMNCLKVDFRQEFFSTNREISEKILPRNKRVYQVARIQVRMLEWVSEAAADATNSSNGYRYRFWRTRFPSVNMTKLIARPVPTCTNSLQNRVFATNHPGVTTDYRYEKVWARERASHGPGNRRATWSLTRSPF